MKKLSKSKNGEIVRRPFTYLVTTELNTKWYWKVLRFLGFKKPRDEFEIVLSYNCFRKNDLLNTNSSFQLKVIKPLL